MAIDTDANFSNGVQASRSVVGTGVFTVGIDVTVAAATYTGYQWEVEFTPTGLAFNSGVVESQPQGMTTCATVGLNSANAINPGDVVEGKGAGCITFGAGGKFVGQTTSFQMHCVADGTFNLLLLDLNNDDTVFGTSLLAASALDTGTSGATIICSGTGATPPTPTQTNTPTVTPIPADTSTPLPTATLCSGDSCPTSFPKMYTRTPTPTATGSVVAAGTVTPVPAQVAPATGAGAGTAPRTANAGAIHLPDTGSGSREVHKSSLSLWVLIASVGAGMAISGGLSVSARRARNRRR
jgi:hypothetical protein